MLWTVKIRFAPLANVLAQLQLISFTHYLISRPTG